MWLIDIDAKEASIDQITVVLSLYIKAVAPDRLSNTLVSNTLGYTMTVAYVCCILLRSIGSHRATVVRKLR